jgi:hypothetical protein
MKLLFYFIPFFVAVLAVCTKAKIVNRGDGERCTKTELAIDLFKIVIVYIVAIFANILGGKNINIFALVIDFVMLAAYLLPLLQKNYNYVDRKALIGILASMFLMLILVIATFQMAVGIYNKTDPTLFFSYLKAFSYFAIAIWCCFTPSGDKQHIFAKVKGLFISLRSIFRNYTCTKHDYILFSGMSLILLGGANYFFEPICVFGFQDLLRKKKVRGWAFIITGNVAVYLKKNNFLIGVILFTIFSIVALIYVLYYLRPKKTI